MVAVIDQRVIKGAFFWALPNITEHQKSMLIVFLASSKYRRPAELFRRKGGRGCVEEGVVCVYRCLECRLGTKRGENCCWYKSETTNMFGRMNWVSCV